MPFRLDFYWMSIDSLLETFEGSIKETNKESLKKSLRKYCSNLITWNHFWVLGSQIQFEQISLKKPLRKWDSMDIASGDLGDIRGHQGT